MEGSEWAECCKHTGRKADLLRIHRCGLIAFLDADALPIASPSLPAAITSLWAMAAALPPSADVIGALHDRFMLHPSCFNSAFMLLRPSRDRYEAYRSLVLRRRVCRYARARRVHSRPNDCACELTHTHATTHSARFPLLRNASAISSSEQTELSRCYGLDQPCVTATCPNSRA